MSKVLPPNVQHDGSKGVIAWLKAMAEMLPEFVKPLLGFSLAINLLLLVSPIYMLQVYDRVLTSGSTDTLLWLTVLAVFLLGIYGAAEAGRRRVCTLAAEQLEESISEGVFQQFERNQSADARLPQHLTLLGRVRSVFQNQLITPFFDLPFTPFFLLVLFFIHPLIGTVGLIGGVIIFAVAVMAEFSTRDSNEKSLSASSRAHDLASGLSRQRSAMVAMGLTSNALLKWRAAKETARQHNLQGSAREGGFSAISRATRQILQIVILGAGAALAISQDVSPGAIVASSIVLSRALAPIDQIVGSWRAVTQCRVAWQDLSSENMLGNQPESTFTPLPQPEASLILDRLSVATPNAETPLIRPFSAQMHGGEITALVGSNGSGKTSLLQTLAGAWQPLSGSVAFGGRDLHSWPSTDRGQYVGYVPQNIELLPGTVRENIARMTDADPKAVFDAARKAEAHDMILALPEGYDTPIGGHKDIVLSAGQRQLIGLARAWFGNPMLMLLDEPTANLDEQATSNVVLSICKAADQGAMVVVATHDRHLISTTDNTLLVRNGSVLLAESANYLKASKGGRVTPIASRSSV